MNAVAKASYASVALLAGAQSAFAAINTGTDKVETSLQGRSDNLETGVQRIIGFITNLLYLIAVCYALYGGFLILTSGGDEEKVKKGKTILMHGALGLLVIFLASSIVGFILRLLTSQ
ncbi:MAG: pilin [Patescibacteria group bacterium]